MTSELKVDKLNTVAGGTGNISISDGVKLTGAAGSIVAPGQILQVQATFLGQGSNYGTHVQVTNLFVIYRAEGVFSIL